MSADGVIILPRQAVMILGAVTDEAAADLSGAPAARARLWRLEAENQQRTVGSASSHLPRLKLSDLRRPGYKQQPSAAAPTSQRFLNQMCVLFGWLLDRRPLGAAQHNYGHCCWQKRGIFAAAGWSFSWLRKKKIFHLHKLFSKFSPQEIFNSL